MEKVRLIESNLNKGHDIPGLIRRGPPRRKTWGTQTLSMRRDGKSSARLFVGGGYFMEPAWGFE